VPAGVLVFVAYWSIVFDHRRHRNRMFTQSDISRIYLRHRRNACRTWPLCCRSSRNAMLRLSACCCSLAQFAVYDDDNDGFELMKLMSVTWSSDLDLSARTS